MAIKSFEGGQMPLYRRLPKRGFNSINKIFVSKINLEKIQGYIDKKILKPTDTINIDLMKKLKLINSKSNKLKILGNGEIKDKINLEVDLISRAANEKLKKAGAIVKIKSK